MEYQLNIGRNDFINSLKEIIDYNWKDELDNFQETYEVEIQSQDRLEPWILWCQDKDEQATKHAFYHLMVLKLLWEQWYA